MQNRTLTCRIGARAMLLSAAVMFSASALAAVELEAPAPAPNETAGGESIEEIEVIGQRSLLVFRLEMNRAEDRMFELFNALNSSDDFDVTCEEIATINTHIKQRYCDRGYMQQARLQSVQEWLASDGGIPLKGDLQLWGENQARHEQFSAELKTAAEQSPELASAIVEVVEKRKLYAEERRERARNGFLGRILTGQRD